MSPKSVGEFCNVCIHAAALVCAAASLYFFLVSPIEVIAIAVLTLGAAVALEVIAAVINDETAAHT